MGEPKKIRELNEVEALRKSVQYTVRSDKKLGTIKNIIVFVLVINIVGALFLLLYLA